METKVKSRVKTKAPEKTSVLAQSIAEKDLLQKAFSYYLNQLILSDEIEDYCRVKSIDPTYLGQADGSLYKTLSRRHPSFEHFIKLGILTVKDGKDKYQNHLVVPILNEAEIEGLKFIPLSELDHKPETPQTAVLPVNNNSFKVSLGHRSYLLQGLVKSDHSLKATVKFSSGTNRHVDVVNFYCSGNRKRLIQDICEAFRFPYEEIKADISQLLEICEKQPVKPNASKKAQQLLENLPENEEFTRPDIEKQMLWDRITTKRTVDELVDLELIKLTSKRKPFKYVKV